MSDRRPLMIARLARHFPLALLISASLTLGGCGYNDFQRLDEQTKSAWGRSAEPVPAPRRPHPQPRRDGEGRGQLRTGNAESRHRSPFARHRHPGDTRNAQRPAGDGALPASAGQLGSALSRLLAVSENYPNLKANQGFQDLRIQLEGTENRVTVARNKYIEAVQQYNVLARSFPTNLTAMIFSYSPKAGFTVTNRSRNPRHRRRSISALRAHADGFGR